MGEIAGDPHDGGATWRKVTGHGLPGGITGPDRRRAGDELVTGAEMVIDDGLTAQ